MRTKINKIFTVNLFRYCNQFIIMVEYTQKVIFSLCSFIKKGVFMNTFNSKKWKKPLLITAGSIATVALGIAGINIINPNLLSSSGKYATSGNLADNNPNYVLDYDLNDSKVKTNSKGIRVALLENTGETDGMTEEELLAAQLRVDENNGAFASSFSNSLTNMEDTITKNVVSELRDEYGKITTGKPGTPGQKGADGLNGKDGRDGKDGKTGTTGATGQKGATGMQGATGATGKNGVDGKNGTNVYIAYADSYDTNTKAITGFSETVKTTSKYIGTICTTETTQPGASKAGSYSWAIFRGSDGATTYIAYADNYDAASKTVSGFSITAKDTSKYMGTCTTKETTQPGAAKASSYLWTLIKGENGTDGEDGADGYSTYVAYADNYDNGTGDVTNFSINPTETSKYMGVCTIQSNTQPGAADYAKYTWSLYRDLTITYDDSTNTLRIQ